VFSSARRVLRLAPAGERVDERQLDRPGIPDHAPDDLVGERLQENLRPDRGTAPTKPRETP
jgi:hypothetical protein